MLRHVFALLLLTRVFFTELNILLSKKRCYFVKWQGRKRKVVSSSIRSRYILYRSKMEYCTIIKRNTCADLEHVLMVLEMLTMIFYSWSNWWRVSELAQPGVEPIHYTPSWATTELNIPTVPQYFTFQKSKELELNFSKLQEQKPALRILNQTTIQANQKSKLTLLAHTAQRSFFH